MENLQKEPSGSPTNAQAALKKNTRVIAFWFFALVAGCRLVG
ncbi:unknown [Sutterella sp. CAG:351]|nr:unknown [Sutterella sp. CAG:351]